MVLEIAEIKETLPKEELSTQIKQIKEKVEWLANTMEEVEWLGKKRMRVRREIPYEKIYEAQLSVEQDLGVLLDKHGIGGGMDLLSEFGVKREMQEREIEPESKWYWELPISEATMENWLENQVRITERKGKSRGAYRKEDGREEYFDWKEVRSKYRAGDPAAIEFVKNRLRDHKGFAVQSAAESLKDLQIYIKKGQGVNDPETAANFIARSAVHHFSHYMTMQKLLGEFSSKHPGI